MKDEEEPRGFRKYWPLVAGGALLVSFGIGVLAIVATLSGSPPPPKQQIQQISVVQPPPPPPEPPEMEEPEEPEMEEVETPDEPEPAPEDIADSEAPPADDLGLDAEGVAGSDGFGLQARKGGRGLIGGGGSRFGWYAGILKNDIHAALSKVDEVRKDRYSVVLRIWVAADGRVDRSEIVRGTGNDELDATLEAALQRELRLSEAPPQDMPQPIKIRITSRT